ncbi:alpha/beta hydrolase [Leifsonia sp. NPDC056824]|uniref:alpha/beta hydrolase n=1 Tax=Leifsonia sp. NPDC056824 TaxID=3345953 RepID=UPI003697C964
MGTLAWLTLALGLLAAYPVVRFAARGWRFRAGSTVRFVVIGQVAGLAFILAWCLFAPRADLGGIGWFAIAIAAVGIPLALGDALQSVGRLRVLSIALTAVTALTAVAAGTLTIAPTLATATVARKAVPVTEQTLTDGAQLTVHIPPTASGFSARDAHLFVPPGWLRDPSSTRPVVEMMMGQPGNPTLGATLDALHGIGDERLNDAPFILVVDQLGNVEANPPCSDTSAGKIDTYLSKDVPAWIRGNLPVSGDRANWAIAGYSHGGECAAYLGATHPGIWGNVVSISGPDKPGEHRPTYTRDTYYGGSQATYEAAWPENILAATHYPQPTRAIFVAGALDPHFRPQVEATATAAEKAGWKVTYWAVPDSTHTQALEPGLKTAYNQLIGVWLASGAVAPQADRLLCTPDVNARACGLTQAGAVAGTVTIVDLSVLAVFLGAQLLLFFRRGRRLRAEADAA